MVRAAVVRSFNAAPVYEDIPAPEPRSSTELLVEVVAAGLHPRVRSQADGSHYTSTDELPLVPGIDGVGRSSDGALRYFVLPDTRMGSMAEQTVIDLRRSFVLPPDSDPILVAAGMNPAMSSWVALRQRIGFRRGQSVLVLGATGSAGQLAVQVARHLGAGRVIAAGRSQERLAALPDLGADELVLLGGDPGLVARRLGEACAEVDVVLDYLWGQPAADAMAAIAVRRTDPARPLAWIQIGSVAGPTAAVASAALRATGLQIVGSGQGSVPAQGILAELPDLASQISGGSFRIDARVLPLAEVSAGWSDTRSDHRIVLTA